MCDLSDLCSAGAVALKLLAGQDKPAAMDVDEEENMSEWTPLRACAPILQNLPPLIVLRLHAPSAPPSIQPVQASLSLCLSLMCNQSERKLSGIQ